MVFFEHSRCQIQCIKINNGYAVYHTCCNSPGIHRCSLFKKLVAMVSIKYISVIFQPIFKHHVCVYLQSSEIILSAVPMSWDNRQNNLMFCLRLCITVNMWLPWQPVFVYKFDADWVKPSGTIYNSMTYFLACCMM